MTTYLALTIGPIYKTLSNAKKTRELWGASYLFSYIMREIIKGFREREFIVPYTKDDAIFEGGSGIGLFHDRFIFVAQEGDREKLEAAVEAVLKKLADGTPMDLDFIRSYLQIHIVEKTFHEGDNPILEMTPYLDAAECFYQVGQYRENQLTRMLRTNNSFLTQDAFGGKKSFPSLPQIALHDLVQKESALFKRLEGDDEESPFDDRNLPLKPYHKYYAIVHADGDNMGQVIAKLKGTEAFQAFSAELFDYCKKSAEQIAVYGGETIFAGGDDLLFFAPVVNDNQTVFDLCHTLSLIFDEKFSAEGATLSFGISIQYHKFPLYEALEKSRNLLFVDAKKGEKNAIAFSVTKHSGQSFGATVKKAGESYENFRLFSSNIKGGDDMDNFLHSLHHKIDVHSVLLKEIIKKIKISNEEGKGEEAARRHLENFFVNFFNKEVHRQYGAFFEQLVAYILAAAKEDETVVETVYATLRFIKFIQGDKG